MTLEQYGILLKRLELDDLELVRKWRNDPEIQKTMNFRNHITEQMQIDWFQSINNALNYYFIVICDGVKIGLINAKNISIENKTAEGGIFIWDKDYVNGLQPVYASLCLMNSAFKSMDFFQKFIVHVRKDNPKAITYNTMLGYQINEEMSTKESYFMELSKEYFLEHTERLNKVAQKLTNDFDNPRIKGVFNKHLHLEVLKINLDSN